MFTRNFVSRVRAEKDGFSSDEVRRSVDLDGALSLSECAAQRMRNETKIYLARGGGGAGGSSAPKYAIRATSRANNHDVALFTVLPSINFIDKFPDNIDLETSHMRQTCPVT